MIKRWLVLVLGIFSVSIIGWAEELSLVPGIYFSGAPSYISEFSTRFRDNGGPLSPYGSHIGLKAEVEQKEFAGIRHYACATGKNVLDYSRTGLIGISSIRFLVNGELLKTTNQRRIRFEYYGWEEKAVFDDFMAQARVQFLGLDQYLISVRIENTSQSSLALTPIFYFAIKAQQLKLLNQTTSEQAIIKFAVQPTITLGENYLAILSIPSGLGIKKGKGKDDFEMQGSEILLSPKESKWLFYIFGYNPDQAEIALKQAKGAKEKFMYLEQAWEGMFKERENFFSSLPKPHLKPEQKEYLELYYLSAVALDNALYAPRGAMKFWACVPTKVHYNWFWLWDSGFQALGYSEFKPEQAIDVILSVFQAQRKDGFIAHMADERAKPITPHSQPPVFGFSVGKMIARYYEDNAHQAFRREMYAKGKLFLEWWEKARDENHNGLFEYISQDEGGWDNSPRMKYVSTGFFIPYLGSVGEVIGSKFKPLDNVDLNSWMFLYYRAMADWAKDLGKAEDANKWEQRARTLAGKIDDLLWDEELGCWFDSYNWKGVRNYKHFRVLTPAIWFPAFAGATLDEQKARICIEKHLLNPDEFFGKYPIPTVAYNDRYFDNTIPGWTATIWLVTAYTALEALFKFGYDDEAEELRERLLAMMADQDGMKGIYETYDPITGKYKNEHSTGAYASFQFGWSSAFTMEMILERYQEERFIFDGTKRIEGFIREAEDFKTREVFYQVQAGLDVPMLELESYQPLLGTDKVKIKLTDPYNSLSRKQFRVWIKRKPFELKLNQEYILEL